ncbi:MAG: hypothetical protein RLY78_4289 [Pseudomonadota bacterium]|jgi:DNA-binding NarL/FixJ family response regulator|uniref:Response regulator transcription factor n=1 Tax=Pseudaquabacterium rugosum TaxID=2984194 RepID=A0ABU9B7A3_9BURK
MIRLAVVDQQMVARIGIRQVVAGQQDIELVCEVDNGQQALDMVRLQPPDVLLLEQSIDSAQAVDALVKLRTRHPELPVLVFGAFPEERYATMLLRNGAAGYIERDARPEELLDAIRRVSTGRRYISARVADLLADEWTGRSQQTPHDGLSPRELLVFLSLARGNTLTAVSRLMCLSVKTVSTYRGRALRKLGLQTNSELTYYAIKHGLIE